MTNVHESWYCRIQQEPGLNVPPLCRYDICTHTHTRTHHMHIERGRKGRIVKKRLSFTNTLFLHKYTQLSKQWTENKLISHGKVIWVFSILWCMLSLSLDYQIIPTLLFSTGILKLCQPFNLQVKLDTLITWHDFQTLQLSLQPFWFQGKFTRLTFSYMDEF